MFIVYSLLGGIGRGVAGMLLGFFGAMAYAKATRMSSFDGYSGYFCIMMGLLGAILGFLVGTVTLLVKLS